MLLHKIHLNMFKRYEIIWNALCSMLVILVTTEIKVCAHDGFKFQIIVYLMFLLENINFLKITI